jgi:nitrate/nitrite-specific signal transduction histidine kinase
LPAGAAHLGSGDLGRRITIKTGDEVKALAAQFNDMAGRLAASYAKLEKKVELRTQELSESLQQQTATSDVTVRYLEFSQNSIRYFRPSWRTVHVSQNLPFWARLTSYFAWGCF